MTVGSVFSSFWNVLMLTYSYVLFRSCAYSASVSYSRDAGLRFGFLSDAYRRRLWGENDNKHFYKRSSMTICCLNIPSIYIDFYFSISMSWSCIWSCLWFINRIQQGWNLMKSLLSVSSTQLMSLTAPGHSTLQRRKLSFLLVSGILFFLKGDFND